MALILSAIGLTEDFIQLLRWMVCGPEVTRSVRDFEASCVTTWRYHYQNRQNTMKKHKHIKALFKEFQLFSLNVPASRKSFLRRIERPNSTGLEENCKSKCSLQYEESCWTRGKAVQWICHWPLKREESKYLWNNKEKQIRNLHLTI